MRHAWTPEEYQSLWDDQGGLCAICLRGEVDVDPRSQRVKKLAIDHDHRCCGQNRSCARCRRGLLCQQCNQALGKFADDPARLRDAADYVESYAE
ncbi:MAG: endonuclease domain-containing protein [Pyrinomonadaceae bacterium]